MKRYQMGMICSFLFLLLLLAGLQRAPSASGNRADLPYTVYLPYARRPPTPVPDRIVCTEIIACRSYGAAEVCARPSTCAVLVGSPVTVYGDLSLNGVGVPDQVMQVVATNGWRAVSCEAITDGHGRGECAILTSWFQVGHPVDVNVTIAGYQVTTSFVVVAR